MLLKILAVEIAIIFSISTPNVAVDVLILTLHGSFELLVRLILY